MPKFEDFEKETPDEPESAFRSVLNELKTPREILASLIDLADKSKTDLTAIVGNELKKLMEKVDAKDLLLKLLSQGTIEIDAKIRIVPNGKERSKGDASEANPRRPKKSSKKS